MIHFDYVDASVLVKPFLPEDGSPEARAMLASCRQPIASNLAQLEVVATLHRAAAGKRLRQSQLLKALSAFDAQWARMGKISMDEVAELALRLCGRRHLRAADAIHLATCLHLRSLGGDVSFWCADRELLAAAEAEGFECRSLLS